MPEIAVRLPDVGEGVAQAEVVAWLIQAGDVLQEDAPFVEVMTDKATVELPSPVSGTVLRLAVDEGDLVSVGAPLIWVETETADVDAEAPTPTPAHAPTPAPEPAAPGLAVPAPPRPVDAANPADPVQTSRDRPTAAPAVRRRAADLGLDLAGVTGTGPDSRVTHADLDARLTSGRPAMAPASTQDSSERIRLTGLRRNIANRMQQAHRIPHFSYVEEIEVDELQRLRATLNDEHAADRGRLTLLPFLMRAVVLAVSEFPQLNARFDSENGVVERSSAVHLGIATQTADGLMVPVVRHAEQRDLWEYAAEVRRLSDAANSRTIALGDLSGSTITITSLGALGGIATTPIINAPEVAIIGVNRILERPAMTNGQLVMRSVMNLSSSFDHRIVDGWDAARFIHKIKRLLETPALLFAVR